MTRMQRIYADLIGRPDFSPDSKTIALSGTGCVWLFDLSRPITRK